MHVHDELAGQLFCTIVGALGLCGFGTRYPIQRTIRVVQRNKCHGHARRALKEAPSAHAETLGHLRAHFSHTGFEFALLPRLRSGHEFVARYRLHGNRRGEQRFGGSKLREFIVQFVTA